MKNCIDTQLAEIESKIRENRHLRRDIQTDLAGLMEAAAQLTGESRNALAERISLTRAELETLNEEQARLSECREAVLVVQDHYGAAGHWRHEIDDLSQRHAAEVSAAEAKITELEDLLAKARQAWFISRGGRSEIAKIRARIATQQGILDDLTHEGVSRP